MLFNSLDFAIFLPIVFFIYWFVANKNLQFQNGVIVVASYIFYGWWDWRFLSLILFSSFVDFTIGILLSNQENKRKRKLLLWTSIVVNLGFLGFFKYYNFFLENFIEAFSLFGIEFRATSLNIILPVGISFYTFQTLSYTIDVYKRKLEPTKNILSFLAFVSFFPQLVAGPIERATHLLPQFYVKREFNYPLAVDGMRQILWGLFKKIVIADNSAEFANQIFNHSGDLNGSSLALGALFFTFQIYGDFSGYSDIAIGTSRLFGFDLMRNFAFPYFSRDIAEFWRRWHISLSTWFRDYLYIPLGGSRGGVGMKIRNTFIIFIVSGFWHGANWTFIVWGALNALYFLPLLLTNNNRNNLDIIGEGRIVPPLKDSLRVILTFILVVIAWVFFRAENVSHAVSYLAGMFSPTLFDTPDYLGFDRSRIVLLLILFFMTIEWLGRSGQFAIQTLRFLPVRLLRWSFYAVLIFIIFWKGGEEQAFIYFQF
ncbi:MAG: MBOAT family protein [Bacteroidetes bacterium]|nr:MAG: MBOAT family protein [Bacteroidota bacterium]